MRKDKVNKMMNAREARKMTLNANEERRARQRRIAERWLEEKVSPAIEASAQRGCYFTKVEIPLRITSIEMLKEMLSDYGYEVRIAKEDKLEIGW